MGPVACLQFVHLKKNIKSSSPPHEKLPVLPLPCTPPSIATAHAPAVTHPSTAYM